MENTLELIAERLANIEKALGISSGSDNKGANSSSELPRSIKAYDSYCSSYLDPFVSACTKLGGDAAIAGGLIKDAWGEMRIFLLRATACKEPAPSALPGLLSPIFDKVKALDKAIKLNDWEKHMKTCKEGSQALNWLAVKPCPCDIITSYIEGQDYWANNIRKTFKGINEDQIDFCNTFKALLNNLNAYVKEFHTTGTAWNPRGIDISEYTGSSTTPTPTASLGPTQAPAPISKPTTSVPTANLFAALNKGGEITSGLKTVTKDMQTWREEYKGKDAAPAAPAFAPKKVSTPAAPVTKGPPKCEKQNAKWTVENQTEPITINIEEIKETVYIYGCVGSTITIVGKCKSIILDTCKKTSVIFDNIMASCEIVNSQRINVYIKEKASAVAIDKTDGIVVHLPRSSLDTEVVASKSSEMNISWPDENGDVLERPIPEQYVHRLKGDKVTADVSDLYGH